MSSTSHSPEEINRIQLRIDETAKQIHAGGDFAAQYHADPAGTLKNQGIPDEAVASLLAQASGEDEVSGYMAPVWSWDVHNPGTFEPGTFEPRPFEPAPFVPNMPE